MPTTSSLTESELYTQGKAWFDFLAVDSPERIIAIAALNHRNYGFSVNGVDAVPTEPKGKGAKAKADNGVSEHARGLQLFEDFGGKQEVGIEAKGEQKIGSSAADVAEDTLRGWLRGIHGEVISIRREEKSPALHTLPTLGELTTVPGLESSTRDMLSFLKAKDVKVALAAHNIGAHDVAEGQQRYEAWRAARGQAVGKRAGAGTAGKGKREAREQFSAWLNKWWGIAAVRLTAHPAILRAMGVESKRRGGGGSGAGGGSSGAGGGGSGAGGAGSSGGGDDPVASGD